jgi:predicted nucleic-acid-binding protein
MIGLDTNVFVRYIMQDDPKQSPKANKIIESLESDNPGFITIVSVIELYWVLTTCYELSDDQFLQALEAVLRTKQFVVENADQVLRALRVFEKGGSDFADCLIERTTASAGCTQIMTFDIRAAKQAGMTLIA